MLHSVFTEGANGFGRDDFEKKSLRLPKAIPIIPGQIPPLISPVTEFHVATFSILLSTSTVRILSTPILFFLWRIEIHGLKWLKTVMNSDWYRNKNFGRYFSSLLVAEISSAFKTP